jgi:isoamylase/glycogen operon protein
MESKPSPLGPSILPGGVNFAIYVTENKKVEILLPELNLRLFLKERTGNVAHIFIPTDLTSLKYRYIIDDQEVIDPYAPYIDSSFEWGASFHPFSRVAPPSPFDWEEVSPPNHPKEALIIYEMHVRGFTQKSNSQVKHPGTFLGMIEKIPHLLDLGVNAVELLPLFEFDERNNPRKNPFTREPLCNYWGYDPISFLPIMNRYGVSDTEKEFKTLVRELHRFGIEVIVDVVYNHTSDESFVPFAAASDAYYLKDHGIPCNDSGCGNTLNTAYKPLQELILHSLRFWHLNYHIDGFRFDLATILKKESEDLIRAISTDPILKNCKLIAEPWDTTHSQTGHFNPEAGRWSEWNDSFRDAVRRFIRGDTRQKGTFATALAGSSDLYKKYGTPLASINFVTAHDGFSLRDLVSYNLKHNLANGENNRDGTEHNLSWNCGKEGPTEQKEVIRLREKQMRNFFLALLISKGIPLITMGDEYGHTKQGNNNTWCQDNALTWFNWQELESNRSLFYTVKDLIRLRKSLSPYFNAHFPTEQEIVWHGAHPFEPAWEKDHPVIAFTLLSKIYVAFNASNDAQKIHLPPGNWENRFHSTLSPPHLQNTQVTLEPFSSVVYQLIL